MLKGYASEGMLDNALALLDRMSAMGVRPNAIHAAPVVRAMAAHDRGRALAFMESLAGMGVATNAALWNNFLSGAYERDGMALMEALQQIARMGATGAKPNTDTFNILMSGCCRMDEPWGAKALFDRMKAEGVPPDALSYTTLMGALVQAGKLEQAIEAFQSLEADPRVEPDMAALNMLAYAYSRLDCMEDAIGVLDRIDSLAALEERAPSARGYGAVVAAFAQKNLPEGVFQIMQRFRSVGGVPDELMYNSVVRMCVRNRDWKRALRIAKVMELRGYSPDREVLTRMIQAVDQQLEEIELVPGQATQVKNRRFNEGLERFKFWLGLPNSYYNASWDWDDEE
uniref:Pentatricopeptide repeat-containing protein chloroplastic-like n=1 Tax=Tetraselmis sp. GSL018 TaxID=582737 RepID=A0A061RI50_9CHLO